MIMACHVYPWGRSGGTGLEEISSLGFRYCEIGSNLLFRFARAQTEWRELLRITKLQALAVYEFGHFMTPRRHREILLHHERLALLMQRESIHQVILGPDSSMRDHSESSAKMVPMIHEIVRRYNRYQVNVAIHPHIGSAVITKDQIDEVMKQVPDLQLVVDVGHMAAAGLDFWALLESHHGRVACLHLKDVRAEFRSRIDSASRSMPFCDIGQGATDLAPILCQLQSKKFTGWLTIELERPFESLHARMKRSLVYLSQLKQQHSIQLSLPTP